MSVFPESTTPGIDYATPPYGKLDSDGVRWLKGAFGWIADNLDRRTHGIALSLLCLILSRLEPNESFDLGGVPVPYASVSVRTAAETCGYSPTSTGRCLKALCAPGGPLVRLWTPSGQKIGTLYCPSYLTRRYTNSGEHGTPPRSQDMAGHLQKTGGSCHVSVTTSQSSVTTSPERPAETSPSTLPTNNVDTNREPARAHQSANAGAAPDERQTAERKFWNGRIAKEAAQ